MRRLLELEIYFYAAGHKDADAMLNLCLDEEAECLGGRRAFAPEHMRTDSTNRMVYRLLLYYPWPGEVRDSELLGRGGGMQPPEDNRLPSGCRVVDLPDALWKVVVPGIKLPEKDE